MLGSVLVFSLLFISLITALALYFSQYTWPKFVVLGTLFFLASALYFVSDNYEGWPSRLDLPKSQVIAIEIQEPIGDFKGAIFVWLYPSKNLNTYFWEYVPDRNPRAFTVTYTEMSKKAWAEAAQKIKDGYIVFIEGKQDSGSGDKDKTDKGKTGKGPGDADGQMIAYENDKPEIKVVDPSTIMTKDDAK